MQGPYTLGDVQAWAAVFVMNSEAGFVQWLKGVGLLSDLSHIFLVRKCAPSRPMYCKYLVWAPSLRPSPHAHCHKDINGFKALFCSIMFTNIYIQSIIRSWRPQTTSELASTDDDPVSH